MPLDAFSLKWLQISLGWFSKNRLDIFFFFKKETFVIFLRDIRISSCTKICFLLFFSAKGHVQNCKKANNTKETNKSSARSSSLQSNSKKASAEGSGQGPSSAVQTAAGRKLGSFLKCLLSRSKMLYTVWVWNGMVYLRTVLWAGQVL